MTNHIVLFEPVMPANTGNIARTTAGTDAVLHLIEPLGFELDDNSVTDGDHYFLFGKETTGLPEVFMRQNPDKAIRIPQDDTHIRSLNLSNTVAIVLYEALRQQSFPNLETTHTYEQDKLK